MVQYLYGAGDLLGFLTSKLGSCTAHAGVWTLWNQGDYTVCATPEALDLDVTTMGLEATLKAFRWDLGLGVDDPPLPRSEWKALHQQGRDLGLTVKATFTPLTQDDLRQFVLVVCDNKVLLDFQVDPSVLGMVFMPLALGALQLSPPEEGEEPDPAWVARQTLVEDIGPEPVIPPPPPPPEKPPYPPEPTQPSDWKEPDPEVVKSIETDIQWGVSTPEKLENYLEVIRLHNVGVDYHRQEVVRVWEQAKADIDKAHLEALAAHKRAVEAQDQANQTITDRHLEWSRRQARQTAKLRGFQEGWLSDLGAIYEFYNQAGPRGINGYPMFWSFHVINKADWDRARPAIRRELDRRKDLEI